MVERFHTPDGSIDPDSGDFIRPRRRRFSSAQDALESYIRAVLAAQSAGSRQGIQSDRMADGVVPDGDVKRAVVLGSCDGCGRWTTERKCPDCGGVVSFPTRSTEIGRKSPSQTRSGPRALPYGFDVIGTLTGAWSRLTPFEREVLVCDVVVSQWQDNARRCKCGTVYAPIDMRCPTCREFRDVGEVRCGKCKTPLDAVWPSCPVCSSGVWSRVRGRAVQIAERLTLYRIGARNAVTPFAKARCEVKPSQVSGYVTSAHRRWGKILREKGLI